MVAGASVGAVATRSGGTTAIPGPGSASTISASVDSTATMAPESATSRIVPFAGDSTSATALSVSISTITCPTETRSPSATSQRATLPSSIARESWGSVTGITATVPATV